MMPPRQMTAISLVPPPMSMTMFPEGPLIGTLAPTASASGSSIRYASLAAAVRAASPTARLRLLDHVRLPRAGLQGAGADGPFRHRRHAGWHADHPLRAAEPDAPLR